MSKYDVNPAITNHTPVFFAKFVVVGLISHGGKGM